MIYCSNCALTFNDDEAVAVGLDFATAYVEQCPECSSQKLFTIEDKEN
jgi:hypothetical protein